MDRTAGKHSNLYCHKTLSKVPNRFILQETEALQVSDDSDFDWKFFSRSIFNNYHVRLWFSVWHGESPIVDLTGNGSCEYVIRFSRIWWDQSIFIVFLKSNRYELIIENAGLMCKNHFLNIVYQVIFLRCLVICSWIRFLCVRQFLRILSQLLIIIVPHSLLVVSRFFFL